MPPQPRNGRKAPRKTCPFSGEELRFVETASGWQVRGKNWVSTKLFPFRELAEWEFSHAEGAAPSYPNPYQAVKVVGTRMPPVPEAADEVAGAEKAGAEMADAHQEVLGGR